MACGFQFNQSFWDGAKSAFPDTRTAAGIKWHASIDLFTGVMKWFKGTVTLMLNCTCFPELLSLKGVLVDPSDLRLCPDYGLLFQIQQLVLFLSVPAEIKRKHLYQKRLSRAYRKNILENRSCR